MKAQFHSKLILEPLPDGRNWRVMRPFSFSTNDFLTVVPVGFVTDLASVPKIFWDILPPFGKYTEAAVVHDWLYRRQFTTRKFADGCLRAGMKACGVPRWQVVVIYYAVRWFGRHAWNDDSRKIPQ
ncbi:MAG: DUF1353 domain-containing protein [Patescibacteria group bacterium]|nr:DUF1353 domain-containing protein [Patescibacteria group bacterium]